ncbi:MAG: UdgX family uracil-DNA binding protein [Actinobacteria bacterium]|nr:MAG: UdgX family uracil-DNA binding protein [Actinomycetota bacterium]
MSADPYLPKRKTLNTLKRAVQDCKGCSLWQHATQAVLGEGTTKSQLMLVGEQPGDQEDTQGRPFVGPAGRLLDKALEEAGIDRQAVYVTNAVKHFKFTPQGKRRIHKKPNAEEVRACQPWLEAEIAVVKPKIVAAMGATAARALLGPKFRVTKDRGTFTGHDPELTATVHPSSILRAPDENARHEQMAAFVDDLLLIAKRLAT